MDNKTNKKLAALMLLGAMSSLRTDEGADEEGDESTEAPAKKGFPFMMVGGALAVVGVAVGTGICWLQSCCCFPCGKKAETGSDDNKTTKKGD